MSRRPTLRTELPGPLARALIERSNAAVSPSYTRDHPLVAEKALGVWITDPDGNEFLDMSAGIAVTSTGHCHPRVVAAIQEQAAKLIHMSGTDFFYPVQGRLADRLVNMHPVRGDKCRVYFGNSGTEANEAAMKLARFFTRRTQFVAFLDAFHGRTLGALSLTASKARQREGFGPFLPVTHGVYPDPYRMGAGATRQCIEHLKGLFRTICPPEEVAAIFVEPIQGEGGYIVPPDDWLPELRRLCDDHGILLVFDEVQSGMGRTGKMFAWEHFGVKPDIITLAKGIASGMPLCATIASEETMRWKPGAHASTFGGNPVACAAAHATLDLLEESLVENSAKVGAALQGMLRDAVGSHPNVGEIRGRGLMIGVELVTDRTTKERASELRNAVVMDCFYRSGMVILGAGQNTVRFCPALTLTETEAQTAVDLFATSLHALSKGVAMRKFDGVDLYNLDSLFSDDEKQVRALVREWVEDNVIPIIEGHCRAGTFPRELVAQMGEMGLLGVNLHGYGCAGMSNVAYGLVCQELERGDSGIRSFASVQGSLVMFPIWKHGDEAQKQKYLPKMATGEFIGCFGLTEPDYGSNPGGMVTRAVDDGDSYVLNGAKMWITNGTIADLAVVWAKLDGVIRGFIVEKGDPGFSAPEMKGKHSLKASVTSELVFQDCRIPKNRILGDVSGLKGPFSCLNNARYGIAWGAVGAAMSCFHSAKEYSLTRIQFGKPIASFQLVQNKLAWMLREITKGQLLALQLGRLKDAGTMIPEQVSLAKMNNVDMALEIARVARDIHGANGILDEYPVMRHMANLESVKTYEGTHDIHNLILGRWITGIQAFE